jgi:hypothetical protein
MSQARGFGLNGKSFYTNVCKPCDVNLQFTVTPTNGLGVTSVKSNGYVESVFMNTSTTPTAVNGVTNPDPAAGYALVTFKNNFNYFLGMFSSQTPPTVSNSTTSTTAGDVYVITAVGTTTLAQWRAAGLPAGFTPAVGQSFVAIATGAIGGTGTVGLPGVLVAPTVSVVGIPTVQLNNSSIASNAGAKLLLQFSGPTAAGNTALIATAPAAGTVVSMTFKFDGSSVTIDGL